MYSDPTSLYLCPPPPSTCNDTQWVNEALGTYVA